SAKFDLNVVGIPLVGQRRQGNAGGMTMVWEYNGDLFDHATIERFARQFHALLEVALARPDTRLSRLPLLTAAERRQLLVEGKDASLPAPERCAHQIFEAHAGRRPDAVAVRFEGAQLTYAQLD